MDLDDDAGLYPSNWNSFIGQEPVKRQLRTAIKASQIRGAPLEHVLLASSRPGTGKTSLARLVIAELGVKYRVQSGPVRADDLLLLFLGLDTGDVLLFDEIHKLADNGKARSEWLLHYMQDGILITPLGPEAVPRCTIIGTTTNAGALPSPVLDRFGLVPTFRPYTDTEGKQIAGILAGKILVQDGLPLPDEDCAAAVARAAANQPRIMKRILGNLRNLALAGEIDARPDYDLTVPLQWTGVTPDGLSAAEQQYLIQLFTHFGGRSAGRSVLGNLAGEMGTSLVGTEQQLMDRGLIVLHGTSGRRLTRTGIERAARLKADVA